MSESTQHKIDRIRKPRVHITYDVHIGGSVQKKEIPYVIGILADLSGTPKNPLPIISKRQFINIDRDNINDVLKASNSRLEFSVPNKIATSTDTLHVELNFKNMKDFEPLSIINQIPEIKKIHDAKIKLLDLLAKMENNAILRDITKLLAEDPDFRNKFKDFILSKKKNIDSILQTKETSLEEEESIERILKNKILNIEKEILSNKNIIEDITNEDISIRFNDATKTDHYNKDDNNVKTPDITENTEKVIEPSHTDVVKNDQTESEVKISKPQTIKADTVKESDDTDTTKKSTNVTNPKVEK